MVTKAYTLTPKNVIAVFYWRRWPSPIGDGGPHGPRTGVPYKRLVAGRVEQAAHLAHTQQDARRHSADQRWIHGEYVMTPYRAQVRKVTPVENLSRAVCAGGGDEYHVGIAREHRLLVDCRRQRGEIGEDIVAAAQRQHFADHVRTRQRVQRPVPHLVEDSE